MKDIEIVVFQDKSWVRLKEYQKAKEENKQLAKRICELQSDLSKAKSQIEKICDFVQTGDLCSICKFDNKCNPNECYSQNIRVYTKWELAE